MTNEILISLSDINNNTNNNINAGLDHNSDLTITVFERPSAHIYKRCRIQLLIKVHFYFTLEIKTY